MVLLRTLRHLHPRFFAHVISLGEIGVVGKKIQSLGIPVEALGMRSGAPDFTKFIKLAFRLRALKPDVVHTWMYHADLLGGLAARLAREGVVVWGIHNFSLDADKTKLSTRAVVKVCARLSGRVPKRIISCSEAAGYAHIARGYAKDKIVVIPNGFDLVQFRPNAIARRAFRAELGLGDDVPLVGLVARFHPHKNHAGFIEAAAYVHQRFPSVQFVLTGAGVDTNCSEILSMIDGAGLQNVTRLLGPRSDIPGIMSALDVLVSSSSGEAFPGVVGEAMASGIVCAVTDAGDSALLVGDTGRVVPVGDMRGLAAAIEQILLLAPNERRILGERARARIREYFEIGAIVNRYEKLYEELVIADGSQRHQ